MRMPGHHGVTGSVEARPVSAGRASAAGSDGEVVLRLRGIGKNFGPVQALTGVNLGVPSGQEGTANEGGPAPAPDSVQLGP